MHSQHFQQRMDQPGMVANPARGQLNRETYFFPCPPSRLRIWLCARRVRASRPASAHLFSTLKLNLVLMHGIPPAFCEAVHYLFGQPPPVKFECEGLKERGEEFSSPGCVLPQLEQTTCRYPLWYCDILRRCTMPCERYSGIFRAAAERRLSHLALSKTQLRRYQFTV